MNSLYMTRISFFQVLKYSGLLFCVGGTFLSLIFKIQYGSTGIFESVSSRLLYPAIKLQTSIARPVRSMLDHWRDYRELQIEHQEYKKQLEELQAQIVALRSYGDYAQDTQELVGFFKRYNVNNGVLAQIILKNFDEKKHFFLLDAGSSKGIKLDSAVVYKNCLVGRISEVYAHYSKVTLITDASCKIAAYCSSNRVQGIHEGANSRECCKLAFVDHLQNLKVHDLIVSSGEGLVFPRGFGLGHIRDYTVDGFHYNINVQPLVDFKALAYCYVLQKGVEVDIPWEVLSHIKAPELPQLVDKAPEIPEINAESAVELPSEPQELSSQCFEL